MCFWSLLSLRSLRCRTGVHMCQFPATPRVLRDLHSSKYPAGRPTSALKPSLLAQCASEVGLGQSGALSADASSQLRVTWPCQDQYPAPSLRSDLGGPIGGQCWAASPNQRPYLITSDTSNGSPGGCGDTALSWSQSRNQTENKSTVLSHSCLNILK